MKRTDAPGGSARSRPGGAARDDADAVVADLRATRPTVWINPRRRPGETASARLTPADLDDAARRWARYAPLLARLFPAVAATAGVVDSPLLSIDGYAAAEGAGGAAGRLLLKADHALPIAGSIKARGAIYAVLRVAERLATRAGLLRDDGASVAALGEPAGRALFAGHRLCVASTGNLGLGVGIAGAALGFAVDVHMSADAKPWKKDRLRRAGVRVVEHPADYTAACAAAREESAGRDGVHLIDDEDSLDLFLGYAVAARRLREQLDRLGIRVDARHPLVLHLPCGVGGAPGGIAWGAAIEFGADAHAFFAEPAQMPCMLLGLATGLHDAACVRDIGLGGTTDADGLAVARPSRFVGRVVEPLVAGCYTVADAELHRRLVALYEAERIEIEPSAAAGLAGPPLLLATASGRAWLRGHSRATHVLWTTGGSLVPPEQHIAFRARAGGTR